MKYTLIDDNGKYALILRGEHMTQYAVVSGLDKETGSWDWTCCYYDFGMLSELTKAEALFKALDYYLMRTNEKYISWARLRTCIHNRGMPDGRGFFSSDKAVFP